MSAFRPPAYGARPITRASRRYRSGIRPLEDRVTLSASAWSNLDQEDVASLLSGANYVQNELIVALKNTATTFADVLAIESARDAVTTTAITAQKLLGAATLGGSSLYQLTLDAGANFADTLAAISKWTTVDWAAPNFVYTADARDLTPNDPSYASQYHHPKMQNNLAWDISQGSGVIVAVTDDGVDWDHVDLAANIWNNADEVAGNGIDDDANGFIDDIRGWDFSSNDNNPDNVGSDYHGTHVAGIIAAVTNNGIGVSGTAGQATIMPVRFYGSGSWTSTVIFNSYKYATDNGAKIISTSYNVDGFASDPTFASAVNYAYTRGVLHFNSAGNNSQLDPARGIYDQMLFVASTDSGDLKSSFSNYGRKIDVAAPGSSIYATLTNSTYGTLSGTSMATPNAAAVAALIWSAHPTWTRDQVAAQLLATADNLDALNPTYAGLLGTGRANSYRSLTETIAPPKIKGVTELIGANVAAINKLTVQTVSRFDETTIETAGNWELRSDGADGVFGTGDDQIIAMTRATDYMIGSNEVVFNFSTLATDRYRFTVKSGAAGLKDPFGAQLDGDADGTAGGDYVREFNVTGPIAVASSTPAHGSTIVPPLTAIDIHFDRAYQTSSVATTDLVLSRGTVSSITHVDADTVRFNVTGLTDDGPLTYTLAAGSILGGDGSSLGAFSATINLFADLETPITLAPYGPSLSLAAAGSTFGSIGTAGDVDTFTLDLAANQTLSLALVAAGTLQGRVTVTGPGGTNASVTASAAGASVLLQNIPVGTAGVYTITVDSVAGVGTYTLQALVNGAAESEFFGGAGNDTLVTAQDLAGAWVATSDGLTRAVVSGGSAQLGGNLATIGFETGVLPAGWTTNSSLAGGRAQVSNAFTAAAGTYALIMDAGTASGLNLNEAEFTVNLAGLSNVRLSFAHAEWGDEEQTIPTSFTGHANADGIAFSVDGTTWYRLWNPVNQSTTAWTNYTVNLSTAAAAAGVTLSADTRIRFQQYDDFAISTDGRGWDQISLDADPGSGPDDWYKISLGANESFTAAAYAAASPSIFELYDSAGNRLAAAANLGASFGIAGFVSASGGDYYLRLSSSVSQPYQLVLSRSGTLDLGGNDTLAQAQPVAGNQFTVLGSTSTGDDDYYLVRLFGITPYIAWTETPAIGSTTSTNTLDPALELYDLSGNLVASADDTSPDGRNATLFFNSGGQSGVYRLRVRATEGTSGAYSLHQSGLSGVPESTRATATNPEAGTTVRTPFNSLTVQFSDLLLLSSLSASDLTVNGVAATSVTVNSGNSVTFGFTPPAEGPVAFAMVAGALVDLRGNAVDAMSLSVTNQPNHAPVLDVSQTFLFDPILEDQVTNNGTLVADLLASGAGGDPISDLDPGDPEGIAVTQVFNSNGTWQYSLDGGATWNALSGVSDTNARLLAADALTRVRYIPNANVSFTIVTDFRFRAWDRLTGTNGGTADVGAGGGTSAFSTAQGMANVPITPVNDPPSFTKGANQTVISDGSAKTVTNWATSINPGPSEPQALTFLVTNDNNGLFAVQPTISSNGTLTYTLAAAGTLGTAVVTVRLQDDGGTANGGVDTSAPQTFTISLVTMPNIVVDSSTPANGAVVTPPLTAIDVNFDRAYQTSSVTTSDLVLSRGAVSSVTFVDSDTVRFNLTGLSTEGPLTYTLNAGSILGSDGTSLSAYSATINVVTDIETPISLAQLGPSLSLALGGSTADQIHVGDVDTFTLDLAAGQNLSLALSSGPLLQARITITGPGGTNISSTASIVGAAVLLQNVPIAAPGVYTITVDSAAGTGAYALEALVNATTESETVGGASNNSLATAQDLIDAWIALPAGAARAVVSGASAPVGGLLGSTGFESGVLPAGWTTYSSLPGGHNAVGNNPVPAAGTYALYMDAGSNSGSFVLNEAEWALNLAGQTNVQLSFTHAEFSDEEEVLPASFTGHANGDGVSFSVDGNTWYRIWSVVNQSTGVWTNYSVNLSTAAAAAGVTLGANTRIRFQQYDNSSFSGGDGRGWDEVAVTSDVTAGPEDWYKVTLAAGESFAAAAYGTAGPTQFELYDAAGIRLASSIAFGAALALPGFSSATGGDYYLRIDSTTYQSYQLVLTRGGAIDLEDNDTAGQAQLVAGNQFTVLGSTSMGDDDYYLVRLNGLGPYIATTETPSVGSSSSTNTLDPALELYDLAGNLVASADDTSPDGRNATLFFDPQGQAGVYRLRVRATEGTSGAYTLQQSGIGGVPEATHVTATDPAAGSIIRTTRTSLTVHFSDLVLFTSLEADDLLVNGVGATGLSFDSGNTVTFTFSEPAEGPVSFTIAGGAILDLRGQAVDPMAVAITYTPNDAPVFDPASPLTLSTILEEPVANNGTLVSALIASGIGGAPISDLDAGDPAGIAVTAVVTSQGAWQYSLDDGATWNALSGVSPTNARLLASDAQTRIRFIPKAEFSGTVSGGLTFRAWDQFTGTNGGTADVGLGGGDSAFSIATGTANISVTAVNDVPSFVVPAVVHADLSGGPVVSANWVHSISPGPLENGQGLTFLVTVDSPSSFVDAPTIDSLGTLRFRGVAGTPGTVVVTVRLQDDGGTANGGVDISAPQTFEIRFTDSSVLASGMLDPTFDADGIRTLVSPQGSLDLARDVARQSDGKLVVVGYSMANGSVATNYVVRYNADGTLDTAFGSGGQVALPGPATSTFRMYAVEIAADGKIVVAGDGGGNGAYVARLNADGTFDQSFGTAGIAAWTVPNSALATSTYVVAMTLQTDGKIVLARYFRESSSPRYQTSIGRLTTSGAMDTTFNGTGSVLLGYSSFGDETPYDVAVQSDGKIVVAGRSVASSSTTSSDFFAARVSSTGVLDSTFGTGGKVIVNVGTSSTSTDTAYRLAIQADGKIVLGGVANFDFGLIRLDTAGALDATFDTDGKVVTTFNGTEHAFALALQTDGKIVAGGYTSTNGNEFALARYNTSGALDTTFDVDGKVVLNVGTSSEQVYGMLVQPDGAIVVAGVASDAAVTGNDFALARFNSAGGLDTSFAAGGVATRNFGPGSVIVSRTITLIDGRMLMAGIVGENGSTSSGRYAVYRLLADGSLDATFGVGGLAVGALGSWTTAGFVRLTDGKLLLLDSFSNRIARLTADGALDTSFGVGGIAAFGSIFGTESAMAVTADGAILIAGARFNSTTSDDEFAVARLSADGAVDTSFDGDGQVLIDVALGDDRVNAVAVQADGKILLGGTNNPSNEEMALVRLNADGSLDTTFSGDGKIVEASTTNADRIRSILVRPDGRIVVGGASSNDFAVYGYLADGTLDTSFAGDGTFTLNVGSSDDVYTLLQQTDGKLLAVGLSTTAVMAAFRLTTAGAVDTTFDGGDGVLQYTTGLNITLPVGAALQADGKLVVVGATRSDARTDLLALRYLTQPIVTGPAPAVTPVADQTVDENGSVTLTVSASDSDTPVDWLRFGIESSNSTLLRSENVAVTALGAGQWSIVVQPRANQFGSTVVSLTVSDGATTSIETFTLNVLPVNNGPSFSKGADVNAGAGVAVSLAGWAKNLDRGFPNEGTQNLSFLVSSADPSLFDVPPTIDAAGKLSFTAKASAAGQSTVVTVRVQDDGGTDRGGVDISAPQTFTITVGNAPAISAIADVTGIEAVTSTVDFTVLDIDGGSLTVTATSDNPLLFGGSLTPANLGNGNYRITAIPGTDDFGTANVTVTASDGTHTVTRTFRIEFTNVNDAPTFIAGPDQYPDAGGGAQSVLYWAKAISAGAQETAQQLAFLVTVDDPSLFSVLPTISAAGTLSYTAAAGKSGTANVTVRLQDDGGTANGGTDASVPQTFKIRVLADSSVAGDFDPTFDFDGIAAGVSPRAASDLGRDVALQADGKIVVAGIDSPGGTGSRVVVRRFLADGTLDASFGTGGVVRFATGASGTTAVELAADGKIYVAFSFSSDFTVVRLNADGSLDTTYGVGGTARAVNASTADTSNGLALQLDGKVIVVGGSTNDLGAVRFNADGTVDASFGVAGYFRHTLNSTATETLNEVVVMNDGRIVAVGSGTVPSSTTSSDWVVVRLTAAGSLDTSFSGDGLLVFTNSTTAISDGAFRAAVDGLDRILVTGNLGGDFGLLRLNVDGSVDTSFSADGWTTVNTTSSTDTANALLLGLDGKITLVGHTSSTTTPGLQIARFLTDGNLDTTFDGDGFKSIRLGDATPENIFAAALSADGRITAVGQAWAGLDTGPVVVRLLPDGTPDPTLAGDGILLSFGDRSSLQFESVARAPDGSYVVGGLLTIPSSTSISSRFVVSRYTAAGALDTSFGTGGYAFHPSNASATAVVAIQADGKIVAIGRASSTTNMVRYNADGTLDTTFGTAGAVTLPTGMVSDNLAVQSNGKIIVGGRLSSNVAVARFNADGTLDTSFDGDGVMGFDAGGTSENVDAGIAVQADGRIVIAGTASNGSNNDFYAARLLASGALDMSFDGDGFNRTPIGTSTDTAAGMVLQADGKIVVGGTSFSSGATGTDWGFVRYNADGSLDATFDGDGVLTFTPGTGVDTFGELLVQADGRLVALGTAFNGTATDTIVVRLLSNGRLDPTFAEDGVLIAPLSSTTEFVRGGSIDPDGKIVVAGYAEVNGRHEGRLIRLLNEVDQAPTVAGVYVRGNSWSQSFLDHLDAGGWGAGDLPRAGYALAGGSTQLSVTIPWSNVDRITVRFDRDIDASLGSLTLYNSAGQGVAPLDWRYLDGRTVEFTVPALAADKYLVNIDAAMLEGISDLALDGEWDTSVTTWTQGSGNGSAGGSFNFRFNVLPGDFDSSSSVAFGEIGQARLKLGLNTSGVGYLYRQDYDGSGSMTFGEIGQARGKLGSSISGFADPSPPPDSLEFQEASERDIVAEPRDIVQEFVSPAFAQGAADGFGQDAFDDPFEPVASAWEFVAWDAPATSEDFAADTADFAAASFVDAPEFVASSLFLEPAVVVDRAFVSPAFSVPTAPTFGSAASVVRQATFDITSRFARLALAGPAIDRPSVVTTVRSPAFSTVRSEVRPSVGPVDVGDEDVSAVSAEPRIGHPAGSEFPRAWNRLRRRPETTDAGDIAGSLLTRGDASGE